MMFTELLEKFEELFQPHTPEEVEKRYETYKVFFHPDLISQKMGEYTKTVEVRAPSRSAAVTLGIEKAGLDFSKEGYLISWPPRGYTAIYIPEEDRVKDDNGNVMRGRYAVIAVEKDEVDVNRTA